MIGIVLILIGSLVLDKCGIGMCGGSWGGVVEGFDANWRYDGHDTMLEFTRENGNPYNEPEYPPCDTCDPRYIEEKFGLTGEKETDIDGFEHSLKCGMPDPKKSTRYTCDDTGAFIFTCTDCSTNAIGNEFSTGATADPTADPTAQCLMPAYEDTPYTCDISDRYVSIGPFKGVDAADGSQSYDAATVIQNTDKFPKGRTFGSVDGYEQYPRCDVYSNQNHAILGSRFGTNSYGKTCVKPNPVLDGAAGEGEEKEIHGGERRNIFSRLWKLFVGIGHDGNQAIGSGLCNKCEDQYVGLAEGEGGCKMPDIAQSGPYKCENEEFVAADWIAKYNTDPTTGQVLPRCTVCHDAFVNEVKGIDDIDKVILSSPDQTQVVGINAAGDTETIEDRINVVNTASGLTPDEKEQEIAKIKKTAYVDAIAYIREEYREDSATRESELAALYNNMYLDKNDEDDWNEISTKLGLYTDSTTNNGKCSMPDSSKHPYRCENGGFKFTSPIIRHGNYEDHDTPYSTNTQANRAFNEEWMSDQDRAAGYYMSNGPGLDEPEGASEDQGANYGSSRELRISATTAARVIPLIYCARCGHRLHGNKNYCSECGASMMSTQ